MVTALRLALKVLLIGTGVFLSLAGEQWRESREHRERAQASLRRFHTELRDNPGRRDLKPSPRPKHQRVQL